MEFLIWILFGGVVGWVASMVMNTDGQQGVMLNVIVGIIGSLLGGWLFSTFGESGVTGLNLYSFIVALIGAVVLLGMVRMVRGATA